MNLVNLSTSCGIVDLIVGNCSTQISNVDTDQTSGCNRWFDNLLIGLMPCRFPCELSCLKIILTSVDVSKGIIQSQCGFGSVCRSTCVKFKLNKGEAHSGWVSLPNSLLIFPISLNVFRNGSLSLDIIESQINLQFDHLRGTIAADRPWFPPTWRRRLRLSTKGFQLQCWLLQKQDMS